MKMKKCNVCGEVKPLNEFQKNGKKPDGTGYYYKPQCILCYRKYQNERQRKRYREDPEYRKDKQERLNKWRNDNREHVKEHLNKYRRDRYNNDEEYRKRRLHSNRNNTYVRRGAEGTHTLDEWINTLELFGHKCCYCGSDKNLTKDHVVPLSRGGTNYIENIVPACHSCNSSKGVKELIEWYTRQPFYSKDRLSNIIKYLRAKGGDANAKQD
jgi:5-methylcytosine-specific restriction endonuclease McrA